MKRYSEYKDSGVKWIGEIPGHWNAVSLKRVVKLINEKSNEQNIPYIASLVSNKNGRVKKLIK